MDSRMYLGNSKVFSSLKEIVSYLDNKGLLPERYGCDDRHYISMKYDYEKEVWNVESGYKLSSGFEVEKSGVLCHSVILEFENETVEGDLTEIFLDASAGLDPVLMRYLCSSYSYPSDNDENGDNLYSFEMTALCGTMMVGSVRDIVKCKRVKGVLSKESVSFIKGMLKSNDFVFVYEDMSVKGVVGDDMCHNYNLSGLPKGKKRDIAIAFTKDINNICSDVKWVVICKGVTNAIITGSNNYEEKVVFCIMSDI